MDERFTVKLSDECPYTQADLEDLHHAQSEFWCCGQCPKHDNMRKPEGVNYPREREKESPFRSF
jgi:hypothetical protein